MPEKQPAPNYLVVGRILRPHGIRGELRVEVLADYLERVAGLEYLFVGPQHRRYALKHARLHQHVLLLKLEGCEDRDAAEQLRGAVVEVAREDTIPLAAGEYYHSQLQGVEVVTDAGEVLGEIVDVLSLPGANDVYVVHGLRGEILIPGIRDVVQSLEVEAGRMVVRLLPGLLAEREKAQHKR